MEKNISSHHQLRTFGFMTLFYADMCGIGRFARATEISRRFFSILPLPHVTHRDKYKCVEELRANLEILFIIK